jgi:hypothetical protein
MNVPFCSWLRLTSLGCVVVLGLGLATANAETKAPYNGASCQAPVDRAFTEDVWDKVAAQDCLKCHKPGGDAEDSDFVLRDPSKELGAERDAAMRHNLTAFTEMARAVVRGDQSMLLLKASGSMKHGGKAVFKTDSPQYRILADFVRRTTAPVSAQAAMAKEDKDAPPFFDGVVMLDNRKLLRRVTLSLAGRLPTDEEIKTVQSGGLKAMPAILDALMKEDAFYDRLREAFNDIFLTTGYDGNAEATALSYEHFEKTRLWYQKWEFADIPDPKARQQAKYKIANEYRKALLGEPMKLIEYIVRNDHPFSEIITADYIMMTPYTARGYGMFEDVKGQFKNVDDPFEYIPVRLKALKGRSRKTDEDSDTGFYPHAGILSTFQWLARYPTTETNRNRLRSRMYYQFFLGIDVLELAARVTDAAAVQAKFKVPTMEASECVVCHRTVDPVAGLFQDYWVFAEKGIYGKRDGGWFTDMFAPGYEGENLPAQERWRALQWLGERTVKDPRFAVAMVEHAWYVLTGRKVLLPPKDLDDPLYNAKLRAYQTQRKQTEAIATRFAQNGFNFKNVLKEWILSDLYRADGVATLAQNPQRRAEMDDLGVVRMLAPEQVERKITAVFGQPWGKLTEQIAMLYGGIDAKEVTERAADPSGAMGAIQRTLSNDVACRNVALDFSRPPAERIFFADIEPDVLPGTPENDAKIKHVIAHLHQRVLGRLDTEDSPEVARTFDLFAGIMSEAAQHKHDDQENYTCRQGLDHPVPDPQYTVRAWRAVMTYLLRRQEFLYE